MFGEARLFLIQVDGEQLEVHWRRSLKRPQDFQHGIGILAARQGHHDPVARLDHLEVFNGLANLAAQALGELVRLALGAAVFGDGLIHPRIIKFAGDFLWVDVAADQPERRAWPVCRQHLGGANKPVLP